MNVSISILRCACCRTSSLRKRCNQNVVNSASTFGRIRFSLAILISKSSLLASNSYNLVLVDGVSIPCWIALSKFWMPVLASFSCCSYKGRLVLSLFCKSITIKTIASIALSSMTIFMASLTTKTPSRFFWTGFLLQAFFFLALTYL